MIGVPIVAWTPKTYYTCSTAQRGRRASPQKRYGRTLERLPITYLVTRRLTAFRLRQPHLREGGGGAGARLQHRRPGVLYSLLFLFLFLLFHLALSPPPPFSSLQANPNLANKQTNHGQVCQGRVARVKALDDMGLKAELAQQTVE